MAAEPRRSPLAMAILAFLEEEPMHVYRMQRLVRERGKESVINVAHRNSLYQMIARLQRDGLLRVAETQRGENHPDRVVYEITDLGRTTLAGWMATMLSTPMYEFPEFPAALAFMPLLTPARVTECLEARRAELQQRLQRSREQLSAVAAFGLPKLFLVEEEYKNAMMVAELAWLEDIIDDLRQKKLTWNRAWLRKIARQFGEKP